MTKAEVRARIEELAIIPAVRAATPEDALFAAEAVSKGGLPIVELTMTVPNAMELIAQLVKKHPKMVVGAGTVMDLDTARACLAAGAKFITSPGLDLEIVEFTVQAGVISMPGVMTPSEIIAAGGVNQQTAGKYLAAGAVAVGIGADLIPPRAIASREADWIQELARRYVNTVKYVRQPD